MLELNEKSTYQKQKNDKPKIKDVIGSFVDGDTLKNALDFIVY